MEGGDERRVGKKWREGMRGEWEDGGSRVRGEWEDKYIFISKLKLTSCFFLFLLFFSIGSSKLIIFRIYPLIY